MTLRNIVLLLICLLVDGVTSSRLDLVWVSSSSWSDETGISLSVLFSMFSSPGTSWGRPMLPGVMPEEECSCHLNHRCIRFFNSWCKLLYPTEITVTILSCCVIYQFLFDSSLYHVMWLMIRLSCNNRISLWSVWCLILFGSFCDF